MLDKLWTAIKVNLKKRLFLSAVVVYSYSLFISFPNITVKAASLVTFITAGGLYLTIFAFQFFPQIRLALGHKKEYRIPIPLEIADLSREIGTDIKEVKLRDKLCNAFVRGKTLVLGMGLLHCLSPTQCKAVVAHELGHIKEKHRWVILLLALPLTLVPLYSWSKISVPIIISEQFTQIMVILMGNIAMLAYVMMILLPINWYLELRADRVAAKYIGKEPIKSALLKLSNRKNRNEPSETHPSIADRVKYIREIGKPKTKKRKRAARIKSGQII
jgi:STE24 endopeptidase